MNPNKYKRTEPEKTVRLLMIKMELLREAIDVIEGEATCLA
jgi:hypothetical protein